MGLGADRGLRGLGVSVTRQGGFGVIGPIRLIGPIGRIFVWLVVAVVFLFVSGSSVAQDAKSKDILSIKAPPIDRLLHIVTFAAPSVGREMKYMAILPENYDDTDGFYPVLYLLHGFSQNYTVWPRMGVPEYTETLDLIVVMPDGGNSWFINWADSVGDQKNNWEDYIVKDLIAHVDATFRTIPRREGRAINGLSMGGYGALTIGLRNPETFIAIGSHSGALTYARNAQETLEAGEDPLYRREPPPESNDPRERNIPEGIAIPGFTTQAERYPLGAPFLTVEQCTAHDPYALIFETPREKLPHIYIDCGLSDGLITESVELMQLMLANGIQFTYGQGPGEHRPSYWTRAVGQSIGVQFSIMQRAIAFLEMAPAPVEAEAEAAVTPDEN